MQPRFGVWTPVYGTWASLHHPDDPVDASWERSKRLILEAEELGYESTLVAQHTINPFGDQFDQLEALTAAAALAALTKSMEVIVAIKPALAHPVIFAKQALQIEEISGGRMSINLVNGWFKPEIERAGIPLLEHDERYVYGQEWIDLVERLLTGQHISHSGKYFHVDEYTLRPLSKFRDRPIIYIGGESEPARNLAVNSADVWFLNAQPCEQVTKMISAVAARQRTKPPLKYAMPAFVIARSTDREAQVALEAAWDLANNDEAEKQALRAGIDKNVVMMESAQRRPHIGTNGGTSAGLVGSYDTVARRIVEFTEAGVETFMLQFQPFEVEMRRFAKEVIPRVRSLRGGSAAH